MHIYGAVATASPVTNSIGGFLVRSLKKKNPAAAATVINGIETPSPIATDESLLVAGAVCVAVVGELVGMLMGRSDVGFVGVLVGIPVELAVGELVVRVEGLYVVGGVGVLVVSAVGECVTDEVGPLVGK